jgi:hypothetical protein
MSGQVLDVINWNSGTGTSLVRGSQIVRCCTSPQVSSKLQNPVYINSKPRYIPDFREMYRTNHTFSNRQKLVVHQNQIYILIFSESLSLNFNQKVFAHFVTQNSMLVLWSSLHLRYEPWRH